MKITILGGGITALSTAWALSKEGIEVTLFFTPRPHNATNAAGGMLSPSCEADGCGPDLIKLAVESCRQYPFWIKEIESESGLDCGYRQNGTLLVALHHDHNQELEHLVGFQQQHELSHEWLTRKSLKRQEPNLTRHIGGLFFQEDRFINPRKLHTALRTGLQQRGVCFVEEECTLEGTPEQITGIRQNNQVHTADAYILSDGAWSLQHDPSLPMRPVKGQYLLLGPKEGHAPLIEHVIRTPDVYIIPREDGCLYIGATMEEESFDSRQTAGATLDLLYHAFQVLPGVYELLILEQGCGFRPALRDNQPMIGQSTPSNLWFNLGHYRHGIMLAPAAAQLLANALLHQAPIPKAFGATRFVNMNLR